MFIRQLAASCWDSLGNGSKATQLLRECQSLDPALDQSFAIYMRSKNSEELSRKGSGGRADTGGSLDAASLLKIEHHEKLMEKFICDCHSSVIRFWEELSQTPVNYASCATISSDINFSTISANQHFQAIVVLQPSPTCIRRYANFVMNTLNNKWKGDDLMRRASDLEDEQLDKKREMMQALSGADARKGINLSLEAVAAAGAVCAISLSSQDNNIGTILEAGRLMMSILGHEPEGIVGTNISVLLPDPIAAMHDTMLRKYVASNKGAFMSKTRLVPALHANGYLVNIMLTLFDNPAEQKFLGLIRRYVHILC